MVEINNELIISKINKLEFEEVQQICINELEANPYNIQFWVFLMQSMIFQGYGRTACKILSFVEIFEPNAQWIEQANRDIVNFEKNICNYMVEDFVDKKTNEVFQKSEGHVIDISEKDKRCNQIDINRDNEVNKNDNDIYYNEKKICFICCVNNDELFQKALMHIEELEIPLGYEIEIIYIKNAEYITKEYNKVMENNDAKYKVYLHQDVFIINKNFINNILSIFNQDSKIGMIGVAGAATIPTNGVWWQSPCLYGKLYGNHDGNEMGVISFKEVEDSYENVKCIDGLLMITQYDVKWRDDIIKGWHFYDLSQSIEFIKAGYKVVIPKQEEPWCIHDSGIASLNGYEEYRKIFIKEYEKFLE